MKKRSGILWIAAFLGLAVSGCGGNASSPVSDDASAATEPAAVSTAAPTTAASPAPASGAANEARAASSSDILSVLSVEHQVDVAAEGEGVVLSIAKDEGSAVKAGQILAQLDDRDLQMQLLKARDNLRVAQNNVQYKRAELKAKSAALRRQQELRRYGLSSDADLEQAEFEAKGAEYDLHGWQALVQSSEAEIRRIQIAIGQMSVRAPFSGVVVSRYVREGQTLKKGENCFRVSQLAPLQVRFQIPESSAQRPQLGQTVVLSLVSETGRELRGRIVNVSPTIDPASDSYDVVAQLPSKRGSRLVPGMAVRVHWPAAAAAQAQR